MQGPLAAPVLQHLTKEDLSKLYFGEFRILDINGATCFLTRTGYDFLLLLLFSLSFPFLSFGFRIKVHLVSSMSENYVLNPYIAAIHDTFACSSS